jgi:hypothetical protein
VRARMRISLVVEDHSQCVAEGMVLVAHHERGAELRRLGRLQSKKLSAAWRASTAVVGRARSGGAVFGRHRLELGKVGHYILLLPAQPRHFSSRLAGVPTLLKSSRPSVCNADCKAARPHARVIYHLPSYSTTLASPRRTLQHWFHTGRGVPGLPAFSHMQLSTSEEKRLSLQVHGSG